MEVGQIAARRDSLSIENAYHQYPVTHLEAFPVRQPWHSGAPSPVRPPAGGRRIKLTRRLLAVLGRGKTPA